VVIPPRRFRAAEPLVRALLNMLAIVAIIETHILGSKITLVPMEL
jgi:hypothetical protein